MKFIFDANISGHAVKRVKLAGKDVLWAADMSGKMTDVELVELAKKRGSVLITADKDFGETFLESIAPHPTIIRLVGLPPTAQADAIINLIEYSPESFVPGAVLTGGKNDQE